MITAAQAAKPSHIPQPMICSTRAPPGIPADDGDTPLVGSEGSAPAGTAPNTVAAPATTAATARRVVLPTTRCTSTHCGPPPPAASQGGDRPGSTPNVPNFFRQLFGTATGAAGLSAGV